MPRLSLALFVAVLAVALCCFASCAFAKKAAAVRPSSNLVTKFVFPAGQKTYSFSSSDKFETFGGQLTVSKDGFSAVASLSNSEGDVFLQVRNSERFCIIDSAQDSSGRRVVNIFEMYGAECSVEIEEDMAIILVQDSETSDCEWDGVQCVPVKDIISTFTLPAESDFSFAPIQEFEWVIRDGKYADQSDKSTSTILNNIYGSVYMNITQPKNSAWCVIASQGNHFFGIPLGVVQKSQNALCNIELTGHNSFSVSAKYVPGNNCFTNGLDCVVQ